MPMTPTIPLSSHITEVSEPEVLRLYDFLYNHLTDIKKALFQIRCPNESPDASRERVQLLTTLTNHIGNSARGKEIPNGDEQIPVHISASVNISDYNEFMEKSRGRNIDAFKAVGVFYLAGTSRVKLS
jgi:hypothetical protein